MLERVCVLWFGLVIYTCGYKRLHIYESFEKGFK